MPSDFRVLGDQHRQTQFGVGLERDRKSVVTPGLPSMGCHSVSLLAPRLITQKTKRIKQNLRDRRRKTRQVGAGRAEAGSAEMKRLRRLGALLDPSESWIC